MVWSSAELHGALCWTLAGDDASDVDGRGATTKIRDPKDLRSEGLSVTTNEVSSLYAGSAGMPLLFACVAKGGWCTAERNSMQRDVCMINKS